MQLTSSDLEAIISSLIYSKKAIEESTIHPSNEYKQQKLEEINEVLNKVRIMKREQKS